MVWTLRTAITLLFAAAVILVTVATATLGIAQGRSEVRTSVVERESALAKNIADHVEGFLEAARRSLESTSGLVQSSDLRPSVDEASVGAALDPLVAYSASFSAVLLADDSGRPLVVRPVGSAPSNLTLGNQAAFNQARERFASAISLDPSSGPPFWTVPVEATRGEDHPHFLVGLLNANQLRAHLFAQIPPKGEAMLVTSAGQVVASTNAALDEVTLTHWDAWGGVTAPDARSLEAEAPNGGDKVLVTVNPLTSHAARIVLLSATDDIAALQRQLTQNALLTSASLMVAAIAVGVFVSHRVTQPLRDIQAAANLMGRGDLSARARPRGASEIRALATDFNSMAVVLERETKELLALQRELEDRVRRRTQELRERNQDLDSFAHVVSHDLKAPLRGIRLYADLLVQESRGRLSKEARENLNLLRDRVERANRMIDAILDYSRVGRMQEPFADVDVQRLVQEVVEIVTPRPGFRIEIPDGLPKLRTQPVQLQQVFQNLVSNALKHHDRKKGRVRVTVEEAGEFFEFGVEDDGPGIPSERMERVFDLFQGASGGRDSTGVGLAITKRIVEGQGGWIRVDPRSPRGTRFRFTWPKSRREDNGPP